MPVTEEEARNVLKNVFDPELHLSVADLGLVYGIDIQPDGDNSKLNVRMTLTTPACPYGPQLLGETQAALSCLAGVSDVNIDLVWIPQWDPRTMATDEVKMQMGIFDWDDSDGEEDKPAEKK